MRCKEAESKLKSLPSASHSGPVNQRGLSWAGVQGSLYTKQHSGDLCGDSSLLAADAGWLVDDCSAFWSLWKTDVAPTASCSVRVTIIRVVCKPGMVNPVLSPDSWYCLH